MNTKPLCLLLLFLSSQTAAVLAASRQIDPTKPGGPARDDSLGAARPPSKTPDGGAKETRPQRMQKTSGVITSVTSIDLVLSQPRRKDKKPVRFVLRPDTIKEGNLRPGAQVTVEYQTEGDKNIAKRVRAHAQNPARQK
jgi:hypothetical protein